MATVRCTAVSHLSLPPSMIMIQFTSHIVTLIHILTYANLFRKHALSKIRIKLEKPYFAKVWQEMKLTC
mgnify:CR=1 FL=1